MRHHKSTSITALTTLSLCAAFFSSYALGDATSRHRFSDLSWGATPFGPQASAIAGDFSKGQHITYIRFPAGLVTPIHTHSSDYTGIVISGNTMHWQPGKSETQVELSQGSHWRISANVPHVSECIGSEDCVMAIFQNSAFDFIPSANLPLNDSALIAIYLQVNDFDVEMGTLAAQKGSNAEVRALGNMVAADHSSVIQATKQLSTDLNIRPVLPAERSAADQEHKTKYSELQALSGTDFDKAYLLHEVDFHTKAIAAVKTVLLPNLKSPQLIKALSDVLPAFNSHLSHTTKLAGKLGYL